MKKTSSRKQYVVIGLGRFGQSVAKQLEEDKCMVMAIDRNIKNINMISDYVTHAMCMDITDEDAVKEIGLSNFDGAIVSMGHNLEAAIFAVMAAKESGIKSVIAKAYDQTQGKVLRRVGADEIIYPEREMGRNLAKKLAFEKLLDSIELDSDYSIAEYPVPKEWIGKNLKMLKLREKYHINVIAVKGNELEVTPSADKLFVSGEKIIILGRNSELSKFKL